MSDEKQEHIVSHGHQDLSQYTREEIEQRAKHWFDVALDLRTVQDQLAGDLEDALNALKQYQYWMAAVGHMNDPNLELVRRLLMKYKMGNPEPSQAPGKIFADGQDITETPDAIDGTWEDVPSEITAELVQTEDGKFHWIINDEPEVPDADVLDDEPEPTEPVDPESREWLVEPNDSTTAAVSHAELLVQTGRAFQEEVTRRLNAYVDALPPEVQANIPTMAELEEFFTDVWENEGGAPPKVE